MYIREFRTLLTCFWVKTKTFESPFLETNFFPTSQTPNCFFPFGGGTLPLPGAECTSCEAQQKTITINNVSHRVFLALLEHLEPTGPVVEDSGCFFLWETFRWEVPETLTWASTCVFGRGFFGTFRYEFFLLLGVRVGILEFVKFVMLPSKLTA